MRTTIISNTLTFQNTSTLSGVTEKEMTNTTERSTCHKRTTHSRLSSSGRMPMTAMERCTTITTMRQSTKIPPSHTNQFTREESQQDPDCEQDVKTRTFLSHTQL